MKNRNINRLLRQMKKMSQDVNDTAICKKFEILIKSGDEVDISSQLLARVFEDPFEVDDKEIPELYLLYFRHYRFLVKRRAKAEKNSIIQNKKKPAAPKGIQSEGASPAKRAGSKTDTLNKAKTPKKSAAKRTPVKKATTSTNKPPTSKKKS